MKSSARERELKYHRATLQAAYKKIEATLFGSVGFDEYLDLLRARETGNVIEAMIAKEWGYR